MSLSGDPQMARSYAPAHVESLLISPLPVGLIFFTANTAPALSVQKIKAKLKLCLIKHHTLKVWGVVYSSRFIISALESGKLPVVCPSQFKIGREPLTHTC